MEIQRSRLLAGAVSAIEQYGYAHTTVAQITSRARVSRRTFYELFGDREACLAALLDEALALVEGEIASANLAGLPWRERVRGGLSVILSFFDREPAIAHVCVLQALHGGSRIRERSQQVLARLTAVLDEGRQELPVSRTADCTHLTAEGLVGAAFGILYTRLLREEQRPLMSLLGELMGMIVLPYQGPAAARREQARPLDARSSIEARAPSTFVAAQGDPLQGLPMRMTYRTARVLQCIAAQSGVSNRAVAAHAGIADQGQISKLLARLQRLGLIVNSGQGQLKGEPNAWALTPLGERVAQRLGPAPMSKRMEGDRHSESRTEGGAQHESSKVTR